MRVIRAKNFPENTYLLLDKNFRNNLFNKSVQKLNCKNNFELSKYINKKLGTGFNGGDIKYWIIGERLDKRTNKLHPKFMPLNLTLCLMRLNNVQLNKLDENIISYRAGGGGLRITQPHLPIKITPEIHSIVIHLFGDGAAGNFTPSYTQKEELNLKNFIKKLENCFGTIEKSIYFTQGKHQIKFPKIISDILKKHYSIKSYRTHQSEVPKSILNNNSNKHKLACILAFIVDEGNIRDTITFYNSNKILLLGIKKLVLDCGYHCSEIAKYPERDYYMFNFNNHDVERFNKDIGKLIREYPTCNLCIKQKDIDFIIKRRKSPNMRNKERTNMLILNTLKNGKFTAKQISRINGYAYCTILHCLQKLQKNSKVNREKINNKFYVWFLKEDNGLKIEK